MGLLLELHSSSYVTRNTQNFSIKYCKCYCAISVTGDERCHINVFNDHTALIYVNGKCKHKYIRPFSFLGTQASFVD